MTVRDDDAFHRVILVRCSVLGHLHAGSGRERTAPCQARPILVNPLKAAYQRMDSGSVILSVNSLCAVENLTVSSTAVSL